MLEHYYSMCVHITLQICKIVIYSVIGVNLGMLNVNALKQFIGVLNN